MKSGLKRMVLAMLSFVALSISASANNDKPIELDQLPQVAQQVVNKHFAGKTVAMVTLESGILDKEYDVVFTDGNKIEFDKKGQWTNIECKKSTVPSALVPAQITKHVNAKYAGKRIVKIEKDNRHYDVELSNGLDLTFNKNFKVVEIDN